MTASWVSRPAARHLVRRRRPAGSERRQANDVSGYRFYECQFAPAAATWRDAIRVGQLVHDRGVSAYESFAPQAFAGCVAADIPVVLEHDTSKRAGTVTPVAAHGDWHIATFVLDGPYASRAAEFIEKCGEVSPGAQVFDMDPSLATPITPDHNPTHWYTRARLDEISIVSPGTIARYAGAKVTAVRELTPRSTERRLDRAPSPADRPSPGRAGSEVIHGGRILRRPGIGQVLGVR
jgi:hypothetical protein